MTIAQIAKQQKCSERTVRRRMSGTEPKVKPVKQTLPNGQVRKVLVHDFHRDEVKKAFQK